MIFVPTNNFGILWVSTMITDRPTADHNVAFVRSGSPDQLDRCIFLFNYIFPVFRKCFENQFRSPDQLDHWANVF